MDQLQADAERCSTAPTGTGCTLYHSPVNNHTDGDVQVCLPVDDVTDPEGLSDDTTIGTLPGGSAAFTVASGPSETQFPTILGAYDAVAEWATANGYERLGPPREIAHNPERIEVAWLIRRT